MIFGDKKGLSDVITNVLIILLVIVAVGIIAAFLIPLLRGTTNQAGEGSSCLTVDVLVKKCEIVQSGSGFFGPLYNANVLLSRGVGKSEIVEANIILENNDKSNNITKISSPGSLVEYATISQTVTGVNFKPKSASVAVKLNGARNACSESSKVECKLVNSLTGGGSGVTLTPLAIYNFDITPTAQDSSGNGNALIPTTPPPSTGSVFGVNPNPFASSFSSTASPQRYYQIPSSAFPAYPAAGTATSAYQGSLVLWFKTSTTSINNVGLVSMTRTGEVPPSAPTILWVPIIYLDNTGKIHASLGSHGTTTTLVSASALNNNAWHQVIITFNNGVETLYIDGSRVQESSPGRPQNGWSSTGYTYLLGTAHLLNWAGVTAGTGWAAFSGNIDQVSTYNVALDSGQVTNLHSSERVLFP